MIAALKSLALLAWAIVTAPRQSERELELEWKLRRAEEALDAYRVIDRTRIGWVKDLERAVQS